MNWPARLRRQRHTQRHGRIPVGQLAPTTDFHSSASATIERPVLPTPDRPFSIPVAPVGLSLILAHFAL